MSFSYLRTRKRLFVAAIVVALATPAVTACSGLSSTTSAVPTLASVGHAMNVNSQNGYNYATIDDPADPTTELLGINNLGKICGYYGSPYVGFVVGPSYQAKNFKKENYPGAVATQVAAIDNSKTLAGWYENAKGQIFGFTEWQGIWSTYQDPHTRGATTQVTEILGVDDNDLGVGYYEDGTQILHPFEVLTTTGKMHGINVPGAINAVATGINDSGDIVGWLTLVSGATEGWMLKGGIFTLFAYPAAVSTSPAAIGSTDDIVGSYQDASGNTHGFLLTDPLTSQVWQQVDDPSASGATAVTSVNNHHGLVGYYKDGSGNINGFMATPKGSK